MQTKIILILFLCSCIFSTVAYGRRRNKGYYQGEYPNSTDAYKGVVNRVRGNAFLARKNKIKKIRKGNKIYNFSEIITEEGAQISFSDYHDHKFHLAGSGHVKFINKMVELKRGYLWVQSYKKNGNFRVQTANAQAVYNFGEFIISFDEKDGKSQLLAIGGKMSFKNPHQNYDKITVGEGQFSFVHEGYNHGTPRRATFTGQKSFQKILSLFRGIRPMGSTYYSPRFIAKSKKGRSQRRRRGIASIDKTQEILKGRGRRGNNTGNLIILKNRLANTKKSIMQIYREKLKQVKKILYSGKKGHRPNRRIIENSGGPDDSGQSGVKINIFRSSKNFSKRKLTATPPSPVNHLRVQERLKPKEVSRAVASVSPVKKQPSIEQITFEQSLKKAYKKQPRHKNEVNQLIRELDNYKKNYRVDY